MKARWAALALSLMMTMATECWPEPAPTPKPLQLDETNDGTTVGVAVGEQVVLDLFSNSSTGYQWTLVNSNPASLQQDDARYIPPANPIPGSGGTQEWTFTALAVGSSNLHLEYRRPWESTDIPAAQTLEVTVNVVAD